MKQDESKIFEEWKQAVEAMGIIFPNQETTFYIWENVGLTMLCEPVEFTRQEFVDFIDKALHQKIEK